MNETRNRDCDYIISVNLVTFLILWKIGKHEEAKRYVDINRKLIESLIEDDILNIPEEDDEEQKIGDLIGVANTSLSVILEST
jgi:hypothetical protein